MFKAEKIVATLLQKIHAKNEIVKYCIPSKKTRKSKLYYGTYFLIFI
jgi:hypothetical protein